MIAIVPAEEIARFYGLKRDQKGFFGRCPFHGGDNPRGLTVLDRHPRPIITCHTARCDWQHDILPVLRADGLARVDQQDRIPRAEWIARKKAQEQAARQREQEAMQAEALRWQSGAERAQAIWGLCTPAVADHAYLIKKRIPRDDVRQYHAAIAIPIYFNRELVNVQFIDADGGKRFLPGGQTKGCYHPIQGATDAPVYLCEGWATGVSLHLTTNSPVICAMSTTNMALAGLHFQQTNPDTTLIIAGDNGDAGHAAADEAADLLGCDVTYPDEQHGDFNDAYTQR